MTKLTGHLKKILYFIIPMVNVWRANRIIDSVISDMQLHYTAVPVWALRIRLKQEHDRARAIDAKTDRLGQRILGMLAFVGILFALSPPNQWPWFQRVVGMLVLVYAGLAWSLTVKANATTRMYGYGTDFEFTGKQDQRILAREVFCQEMENTKKHNFNDASVRSLRNALSLGVIGVVVALIWDIISPQ